MQLNLCNFIAKASLLDSKKVFSIQIFINSNSTGSSTTAQYTGGPFKHGRLEIGFSRKDGVDT